MTQIFDIDLCVAGRVRRFIYIVKQTADGILRGFLRCSKRRCRACDRADHDIFAWDKIASVYIRRESTLANKLTETICSVTCDVIERYVKRASSTRISVLCSPTQKSSCSRSTLLTRDQQCDLICIFRFTHEYMQLILVLHLQLRCFECFGRDGCAACRTGVAADDSGDAILYIVLACRFIIADVFDFRNVVITEIDHRCISEGGIARAGIEDRDDRSGFQLIDDGVVSTGRDGFIERAERQHHLMDFFTAIRVEALDAMRGVMDHIIVGTAGITCIRRDHRWVQLRADGRFRHAICTPIRFFREAVEVTGGLCDAEVILRGDKDFLRGAVHLHQSEILLVLHHRNEGNTREDQDDRDGDQHLRQREAFSVESFLYCICH